MILKVSRMKTAVLQIEVSIRDVKIPGKYLLGEMEDHRK